MFYKECVNSENHARAAQMENVAIGAGTLLAGSKVLEGATEELRRRIGDG